MLQVLSIHNFSKSVWVPHRGGEQDRPAGIRVRGWEERERLVGERGRKARRDGRMNRGKVSCISRPSFKQNQCVFDNVLSYLNGQSRH